MSDVENKLKSLGIVLEAPKPPVANYLGAKMVGDLLYVSGLVSSLRGVVGGDISEEEGKKAARETAIRIIAIVKKEVLNLDKILGVIKLQGFIRSAEDFTRQPHVLDGASELLILLFGDEGRHARTATGVNQLPFGAAIQIDMILQLKKLN